MGDGFWPWPLAAPTGPSLVFLKHQEIVIWKEPKILYEFETGLFGFADDLGTRHQLLRLVRRVWTVGRIVDDGHAAMGVDGWGQLAIKLNAVIDVVRSIAKKNQIHGIDGEHRVGRLRNNRYDIL